tara:strand:+ start:71 stop:1228 length:1158 start_codon:yes stop_codon:yes gene_type:complete
MSEIKVNSIKGVAASSAAITINNTNGTCAVNNTQRQGINLVTNGAMRISQRGASFSTVSNNETTIDQFALTHPYGSSQMSISQSTTSPDGFSNSYKLDVNSADTSIGSGQYVAIRHRIEAQNLQQLAFGTSSAKSISLSFYVRSNVTGTYAVNIQQTDNSKKQVSATYTINNADTWERKTFTFPGDTSGVINNDTGDGFEILFWLAAGSNRNSGTARSTFTAFADADQAAGHTANILSSTSNNFHLTGVQLEASDAASDFEHLSIADDLAKCQRYFLMVADGSVDSDDTVAAMFIYTASNARAIIHFPVSMRTIPDIYSVGGTDYFRVFMAGGTNLYPDAVGGGNERLLQAELSFSDGLSGMTPGQIALLRLDNAAARIGYSAEL